MLTIVYSAIWEILLPERGYNDAELRVLGRAIRGAREQRGMSPDELAGATGMSRQRIHELETGHLDPSYELLVVLAEGLDMQISVLIALVEELKEREP